MCIIIIVIVTEREVRRGILHAKDPEDHCLAFIRHIDSVNTSTSAALQAASNFIDLAVKSVDEEAALLLAGLRDTLVPANLPESNIAR